MSLVTFVAWFGPAVNRTGRLRSLADGGQIFESQMVKDLTSGVRDFRFADRGVHSLREGQAQRLVGACLDLPGPPRPLDRQAAQGVEQDGLANAPEPGYEQGLLGVTAAEAVGRAIAFAASKHDVTPDKARRAAIRGLKPHPAASDPGSRGLRPLGRDDSSL